MTRIHQVKGRDLRDALERARDQVGEQAVVLSRRSGGGGVTLALAEEAPRSASELELVRGRARTLLAHSPEVRKAPAPRPSVTEIEHRLAASGTSQRLIDRIVEAVAGRLVQGGHPLDLAGEEIDAIFPVAQHRRLRGATSVIAALGSPGSGKTTFLAKLGLRLHAAGRRVALVTTDTHRVGAVEQAKALGRHIGCPAIALRDPARLAPALEGAEPALDVVLVDTTGRPASDGQALDGLAAALATGSVSARLERLLLLPASAGSEALRRDTQATPADGCVLTRLDHTARPAEVLECALQARLPLAFLSDGPELDKHLHRPTSGRVADLLLTGRLS